MKRILLSLALALSLTACAGFTPKQNIATSCVSAASALDAVTAAKLAGKVSAEDLGKAISLYKAAVIPVCVPVAQNLDGVKRAALAAAIAELTARAARSNP
jgi:hypothetical protein